jgi:endo-beta-N-acetylglucosaminidase D
MERQENAQEAMKKTPEELVIWAIERSPDDSYRQSIVKLEFERRVAAAQIETAKSTKSSAQWMLCSVIVLALTGFFTVVVQYEAWMHPHIAK